MTNNIVEEVKQKLGKKVKKFFKKNESRFYIDISPADVVESSKIMFNDIGLRFAIATGVDTRNGIEMLYHFSSDKHNKMFTLRALLHDKKNPQVDSISHIIKGAEWIERETWELVGVNFKNHPDLKHLLLDENWPKGKFPLRKDQKNK